MAVREKITLWPQVNISMLKGLEAFLLMFSGYCEVTGEAWWLNERDAQVQEVLSPGQRMYTTVNIENGLEALQQTPNQPQVRQPPTCEVCCFPRSRTTWPHYRLDETVSYILELMLPYGEYQCLYCSQQYSKGGRGLTRSLTVPDPK